MAWIGPQQCEDNCCGPPTPCPPPVVTCRLYADGYGGGSAFLAYTIEDADTAWVRENCSGVITDHPITLTSGAASGNFSPIDYPTCQYTVFAQNECGTTASACECSQPVCTLTAERVTTGGNVNDPFTSVRISWTYSDDNLITLGNRIVSVTLNGVDVWDSQPHQGGGEEFILEPVDLEEEYELIVTNDCGRKATCTVTIPCCWRQSLLKVTISGLTDVSSSCTDTTVTFVPRVVGGAARYFHAEHEFSTSGLAGLNQTVLFNLKKFDCALVFPPEYELLGTVTVYERNLVRYEFSSVTYEMEIEHEYDVDVYLLGTVFYFALPSGEMTQIWRFDEFPALNRNGQYCVATVGATTPPCAAIPIGQGRLETMYSDEGGAPCGLVATQNFYVDHRNGVEPPFNSTEASAYRPPVDFNGRVWCYAGGTPFGNKITEFTGAIETEYLT